MRTGLSLWRQYSRDYFPNMYTAVYTYSIYFNPICFDPENCIIFEKMKLKNVSIDENFKHALSGIGNVCSIYCAMVKNRFFTIFSKRLSKYYVRTFPVFVDSFSPLLANCKLSFIYVSNVQITTARNRKK